MKTNEKFLSFYYRNMKEIPDIHLDLKKTALLIVDMQKHFIAKDGYDALQCKEAGEWDEWEWFYDHVERWSSRITNAFWTAAGKTELK